MNFYLDAAGSQRDRLTITNTGEMVTSFWLWGRRVIKFQNSPVVRNKTKPDFGGFKFSRKNLVDSNVELNLLSLT